MNKGVINKNGFLFIERNGVLTEQSCPFSNGECGDWCPLFREPEEFYQPEGDHRLVRLDLCHATLYFLPADFKDERKAEDAK